jgi:hypothetical protein
MLVESLLFLVLGIVATGGVETSLQIFNTVVELSPETSGVSNTTETSVLSDGVVWNSRGCTK